VNCWARYTFAKKNNKLTHASCLSKQDKDVLDFLLVLAVGVPVILLKNLATELGLVNGSVSIIYDIMYDVFGVEGIVNP